MLHKGCRGDSEYLMTRATIDDTRLDLAYISPLNPVQSGLSDYSEALLPALSEFASITLYSDCGMPSNPLIAEQFRIRPIQLLPRYRTQHDLRLYQIGNSTHHQSAFDSCRRLPGVITLHEPFLHHGFCGASSLRYRREVFYELGCPDRAGVERLARCLVDWTSADNRQQLMVVPLIGRLVDSSLGIIVHSRTARQIVESHRSVRSSHRQHPVQITVIPQPMHVIDVCHPLESRVEFGWPEEAVVFGIAGAIQATKEPHLVLRAFARGVAILSHACLAFMGETPKDDGLPDLARELGVADRVTFVGRVDPLDRMHRAMAACDVIINLRQPTIGETSGTALRAMALGRPLIVRDVGWYSELPDEACLKIGPGAGVDDLASAMLTLGTSSEARQRLGDEARRYVQTECDVSTVARRYAEFLWAVYEQGVGGLC